MRVVLSGGGTGGHISPLLAVAVKLGQHKDLELIFVGSKGGMEERLVPASGIEFVAIPAGKLRRYGRGFLRAAADISTNLKNARDMSRVARGYLRALKVLQKFKPDVVMIKGGYVSLPVGLAAITLRIPIALHESDAEPGLTNRFLAKHAQKIFVSMPMVWRLPKDKVVYTGNPVRSDITAGVAEPAKKEFGLDENLPVLLIIGGSQGAHEINLAIFNVIVDLLGLTQVVQISGERDFAWLNHERDKLDIKQRQKYLVFPYLGVELPAAYRAADLVISRASANVMAEIAAVGKPSILIPGNFAQGHQLKNAQVFAREGAATIIRPSELKGPELLAEVKRFLASPDELLEKGRRASALFEPEAADTIAKELVRMVAEKSATKRSRRRSA